MKQRRQRIQSLGHIAFLHSLPCIACGNDLGSDAAHIRFTDPRASKRNPGIGQKPSDMWTVPLCRVCHSKQHSMNERAYWAAVGVDPVFYALALWAFSGDYQTCCEIVLAATQLGNTTRN